MRFLCLGNVTGALTRPSRKVALKFVKSAGKVDLSWLSERFQIFSKRKLKTSLLVRNHGCIGSPM